MRTLRAFIVGMLSFFPATILGYLLWLGMGASEDNYSFAVWFPCNVIPFAGMILGCVWAWKTGEEYGVDYQE